MVLVVGGWLLVEVGGCWSLVAGGWLFPLLVLYGIRYLFGSKPTGALARSVTHHHS
jgi:hypothetical protein